MAMLAKKEKSTSPDKAKRNPLAFNPARAEGKHVSVSVQSLRLIPHFSTFGPTPRDGPLRGAFLPRSTEIVDDEGQEFTVYQIPKIKAAVNSGGAGLDNKNLLQDKDPKLWAWFYANQPPFPRSYKLLKDKEKYAPTSKDSRKLSHNVSYLNPPVKKLSAEVGYRFRAVHNYFSWSRNQRVLSFGNGGADEEFINAMASGYKRNRKLLKEGHAEWTQRTTRRAMERLERKHSLKLAANDSWYDSLAKESMNKADTTGLTYDEYFMGPHLLSITEEIQKQREERQCRLRRYHYKSSMAGLTSYLNRLKHRHVTTKKNLPTPECFDDTSSTISDIRRLMRQRDDRLYNLIELKDYNGNVHRSVSTSYTYADGASRLKSWLEQREWSNETYRHNDKYFRLRKLRDTVAFRHFTIYINRLKTLVKIQEDLSFLGLLDWVDNLHCKAAFTDMRKQIQLETSDEPDGETLDVTHSESHPGECGLYAFREKFLNLGPMVEGTTSIHIPTGVEYRCENKRWVQHSVSGGQSYDNLWNKTEVEAALNRRAYATRIDAKSTVTTKDAFRDEYDNLSAFKDKAKRQKDVKYKPTDMRYVSTEPPKESISLILPPQHGKCISEDVQQHWDNLLRNRSDMLSYFDTTCPACKSTMIA